MLHTKILQNINHVPFAEVKLWFKTYETHLVLKEYYNITYVHL